MAKDKKKKDKKADKKPRSAKAGKTLKSIGQSALVAEVVAAALVATAAALKDSKRARALASDAADELGKLSKAGSERGSAMWELAMQVGRRSLEALAKDIQPKGSKSSSSAKQAPKKTAAGKARRDA